MVPRNVLAIRKCLGPAIEIVTTVTNKNSTATLLDHPTGAYTGMRTMGKIGIMDFTGHTTRLANSLQQIKFPGTGPLPSPTLSSSSCNLDDKDVEIEDPAATRGLAVMRQPDVMKSETTDLVREGLKFYYKNLKQALRNGELAAASVGETKVTVLCTWDPVVMQPALIAHFEPLGTPKTSWCKVEVHGSPRDHATAKDSQWVRDRKKLEDMLAPDSNEALLIDDETQDVYEGLSSNFFVLDSKRRTVMTAPIGTVLQGTIQKVILSVCEAQNIPVDYTFPNLKHIDDWEAAFISSTSRLLLPIEKLVLPDGSIKTFENSSTVDMLRREVLKECHRRVENLISEEDL